MSTVQFTPRGFLRACTTYLVPGLIISVLLSHVAEPPTWQPKGLSALLLVMIPIVLVAPLIETFVLIYPTSLAGQVQKNRWAASVTGAIPLVSLHFVNGWPSVVGVAWGFVWSAHCWLALSEQEIPFWPRYAFLVGMHAVGNVIAISLGAFD